MLNKVSIHFLGYFFKSTMVLILISAITTISAAPRKPVYSSSSNSGSLTEVEQSTSSIESRLARLERLLESQSLVDLLLRLDNIQAEIQRMRGDIEVVNYSINDIKKRQRDLYIDVDRRLVNVERPSKSGSVSSSSSSTNSLKTTSTAASVSAGQSSSTGSTGSSKSEQKLYQQAFNLLSDLRYDKSIELFNAVIVNYPKGRYAHIAQYWVGEAYYAQQNYKQAIGAYQKLITNYSKSAKVAEALLKIGYSYYELNNISKAKTNLQKLVKLYPDTTEASQAKSILQKIKLKQSKR